MEAIDTRTRRLALGALVALILLLMLPNLLWLGFGQDDVNVWIGGAIMPAILLLVLFALLGDALWLACALLLPLALLAPMEAFYIGIYHHPTSAEALATIFATNPREMREYLGGALLPMSTCVVAALVLTLLATWWSWRAGLRWRHASRAWVLALSISTPITVGAVVAAAGIGDLGSRMRQAGQTLASVTDPIRQGYPFGLFLRIADYHDEWVRLRANVARLDAFHFHAHPASVVHRRQVYVLVIGEASRRDHWQLFGYSRSTNPELSRIRNLVPITDMDTSWPESITAIPMLITRKPLTMGSINWSEASIVRAMDDAGYDTWWISNQMPIGQFDSPVSTYAYEARHTEFLNHTSWWAPGSYDDVLLKPLRDALLNSDHNLFVVLHLMGSHHNYDYRYPGAYRQFRPTVSEAGTGSTAFERVRNSYDNSILYTDHVLASVIGILQASDSVAALWYASDHGESLPTATCSLEEHGNGTRYEYEISAFFWASDAYLAAFPQRVATLRANAGKRTLSADSFESLIDMTNTTYPGRDPSWSLFDTRWHYRSRIVNVPWQVNIDEADFSKNCQMALPAHG
jgi:glucan phosphoethanolaminetransferase (alkaline phosphatase superfamily)